MFLITGCRTKTDEYNNTDDLTELLKKKPAAYHYSYDSTKSGEENFIAGYMDSFSIGETTFRILCNPDPGKELLLQKKKGDTWEDNLYSFYGIQGYTRSFDVNLDRYPDFVFLNRFDFNAYLFDSVKKRFNFYPVNLSLVYGLFDSSRNIFHQEWDCNDDKFCTQLFRFRDSLTFYLYSAYKSPEVPVEGTRKPFRLYRCENGKMRDTVFLRTCYADSPFSSVSMQEFWKRNCPK